MKKINKLVLSIGTAATVVTPIVMVISCGSNGTKEEKTTITQNGAVHPAKESTDFVKIGDSIKIPLAVQKYRTEWNKYEASFNSYKKTLGTISNGVKKVQEQILELGKIGTKAPTPLQVFYKSLIGDGAELNSILEQVLPTLVPNIVELTETADSTINTDEVSKLEILKLKAGEFNLKESSNTAITGLMQKVASYLKANVPGDKIAATLNTLIDTVDLSTELPKIKELIIGLLPSTGILAQASQLVDMLFNTITKPEQMVNLKKDLKIFIDVIDFQKIIDKVNYYLFPQNPDGAGLLLPSLTTADGSSNLMGVASIASNIEGLLLGDIFTMNKHNYQLFIDHDMVTDIAHSNGGEGLLVYFMAVKQMSNQFFKDASHDNYESSLKKLEVDFPSIKNISPSIRAFTDHVLTLLFEGIDGKSPAGLDQLDLNLVNDATKIKAFVGLIHDTLKTLLNKLSFKELLTPDIASTAYGLIEDHKDDEGIIGKLISPIASYLGSDAVEGKKRLGELLSSLGTILDGVKTELVKIGDSIKDGTGAGYVVIDSDKAFYSNLKQGLIDLFSLNLGTINHEAITSIRKAFPTFVDGTVLDNLLQLLVNELIENPSIGHIVIDLFPGANFNVDIHDQTPAVVTVGKENGMNDIRILYKTYTQNQINWIFNHKGNWDLSTQKAIGDVYKDKDGKILVDSEITKGIPDGATKVAAILPKAELSKAFEADDAWMGRTFPQFDSSQYKEIRDAMLAGNWNYGASVDDSTGRMTYTSAGLVTGTLSAKALVQVADASDSIESIY